MEEWDIDRAVSGDIDRAVSGDIHRAVSGDGTEIAGHVVGEGPPLVLVHGDLEDGGEWAPVLGHLRESFTCYLMSRRGRGLSGDGADHTMERLVADVTAFVDSVGGPVRLFGESGGGHLALGAAARSDAVQAVAVYEPVVFDVLDEPTAERIQRAFTQAGRAVAEDRPGAALYALAALLGNDDELAALSAAGGDDEELVRYIPTFLRENTPVLEDARAGRGTVTTAPAVLAGITAPVLLMYGAETALRDWITAGIDHLAAHVAEAETREVAGAGHFALTLAPDAVADPLVRFLAAQPQPA